MAGPATDPLDEVTLNAPAASYDLRTADGHHYTSSSHDENGISTVRCYRVHAGDLVGQGCSWPVPIQPAQAPEPALEG